MAEKDPSSPSKISGPELRLVDRRAFVGFPPLELVPGVSITDFALQIPDVTFPLNLSGGASKYQKKKLDFGFLDLTVDAEVIQRAVRQASAKLPELDDVKLHFRPGHLEVQGRLRGVERAPVTFKVAFDGEGERLAVYLYDVRLYAFSATPASRLGAIVSEAIRELGVLPDVERRGASGFSTRILPPLVEQAAVARGYKMPALDQARLAEAVVSSKGLRLRFTSGGLPPPGVPDEELLLALEGARAFADAEELLALNQLGAAREAYLRLGDATEAHPFAVERLLTLLVADVQAHELALDVAASLQRRREKSATALWAEAVVRERRGEFGRAAERYLALSTLARKNQEEAGAFFSAEAAARSSKDNSPQMAVKALHELLGLKPDHVPSLKALARASDQAKDRAGAIRAYRRLAALARDPADAADAHVHLARLCAQTEDDLAGARLHCEAALRLAPDHPDALFQLGELCYRSGEWLRAVKALDRVREVSMGRHEVDRVGRANVLAGLVWETGLRQPENALLRFREAASLLPGEAEPQYLAARVSESLGKVQEALAGYQQAVELAGPAPRTDEARRAAHASHHALARLLKTKLGEPARAREHLEAALALDPQDTQALDELLPYFRAAGKAAELAEAAEKAAAVLEEPTRRAALWAEAGELYRGRLNQPEKAERLLSQALEADPKNRQALEGLLALAESRRDGGQLVRTLRALAELAEDPKERVRHHRRLIVAARDLAFDLEVAAFAARKVLELEPDDLPVLGELTALERRRSDMAGLAWALEQRARVAEAAGDKRLAAAALRELSSVLDQRLGRAAESLVALEKATRLFADVNGLLDLATLSLRLERPLNARRALEDVLALLPRHAPPEKVAEVRARLGRACELLGDREAAKENYALAFPLRKLDDELAARLEALYVEGAQLRELTELWATRAQALLNAGRALDAAPLFFRAARTLLEAGDSQGAMLRLTAALDAAPNGEKAGEALEAMAALELERGGTLEAARLSARRAALATDPTDAARWFARAAELSKDTPREQPYLAQSLERDPGYLPARLRRAELFESLNPREALADLEAALGATPEQTAELELDVAELTRRAAQAAQRSGQLEAARRHFARYAQLRPDDLEGLTALAALYRRAGALEPLVSLLEQLWPRLSGAQRDATRREFAEGALSLGRTEAALAALRATLVDAPDDGWAAARLLALLPADDAHRGERLDLLTRLIAAAQGEARAELLSRRAELHREGGDLASARADLLDASQAAAEPLPLLRSLASLSRDSGDEGAELAALALVLEHAAGEPAIVAETAGRLVSLAKSRFAAQDLGRSLEALELVVRLPLQPVERFEAYSLLAQVARATGHARRAEEALLEASAQGPVPGRVEALVARAHLLESREALAEAIDAYERALALAPRHPLATAGLIAALRATEDWEGLAEVLSTEAASAPRPQAIGLFAELASLYFDRLAAAGPGEAALRRVVTLDEHDVPARLRLAWLLSERGERAEAVQLLEAAAALQPPAEAATSLRRAASLAQALENETGEALRLLRAAHALVPATGDDLRQLTELLYLRGATHEVLPLQRRLAESISFHDWPDVAEAAWLRLADVAMAVGDLPLAESSLRRVVVERPLNDSALERLAALVARTDARAGFELRLNRAEGAQPSPRNAERLVQLAREARDRLSEVEVAARLFARAAAQSEQPLSIHEEAVELLREAGRTAELMAELAQVAQLRLTDGDVDGALDAWREEAGLAEGSGRIDDALRTLAAMAELCAEEGRTAEAAALLTQRAELLRDSKLDLGQAMEMFERAWELAPSAALARDGLALARRRDDRETEIDWLERLLGLRSGAEQAVGFVQLARLHVGLPAEGGGTLAQAPMLAPDQAEAALQRALVLMPDLAEAEQMLLALYERQDRVADMAAWYEAAATRAPNPEQRAERLLRAAALYKDRAGRPHDAAAALLAARSARPDDLELTARVADLLVELGRRQDAADFDALVLDADANHPSFERHTAFLRETGDDVGLATVLSRRAEVREGPDAAALWLEAAVAFRRAGALERAQLCEARAFEVAPTSKDAFDALMTRNLGEPKRQAELLAARAQAVPHEASSLLKQRAELLASASEPILAAAAYDEYLALIPDDVQALEARATLAAESGGARASQPFDRRLVQLAGASLPVATQRQVWMRLGHAALESQAWLDAIDAFEAALSVEPSGPRARETLSSLSEAYTRARDERGQYRTSMRLAAFADGSEAEALYRRALSLTQLPEEGLEALEWLLARHPGESGLYERAQKAYRSLGRVTELVSTHERYARAAGGPAAATALLAAAELAARELGEAQRAFELKRAAFEAAPTSIEAAEAVLADARARGDEALLEAMLVRLAALTGDEQRAADLKLELASLYERRGQHEAAKSVLAGLRALGAGAAGYREALAGLERLARVTNDVAALAELQLAAAELLDPEARAQRLLEAARSFASSNAVDRALQAVRAALATRVSREALELSVALTRQVGDAAALARALMELAEQSSGAERSALRVEAVAAHRGAGDVEAARALLERVVADERSTLSAQEAGRLFLELGAPERAVALAFEPAMAGGRLDEALALAEAAHDERRVTQALRALAIETPRSPYTQRYLSQLVQAKDAQALQAFAEVVAEREPALSAALRIQLVLELKRLEHVEPLVLSGAGDALAGKAVEAKVGEVLVALMPYVNRLSVPRRRAVLEAIAEQVAPRRLGALRQLAELHRAEGDALAASSALEAVAVETNDAQARSALHVERGELLLGAAQPDAARVAFERALMDDGGQLVAIRRLVELLRAGEPSRFVAMAERLAALAGLEALAPWHAPLSDAYEALNRLKEAYLFAGKLEETRELLERRRGLAEKLELKGDAVVLSERLATTRSELEAALDGYLRLDLVPFAVRLGERLMADGPLPAELLRFMAERLAPTAQGAGLAAKAWPTLLRANVTDIDGWTLYAEALRRLGQAETAVMIDGFGAALTSTHGAAPVAVQRHAVWEPSNQPLPPNAVPLTEDSMPRLFAALNEALTGYGVPAGAIGLFLDVAGGVEAWLAESKLVLGAGALTVFAQTELTALVGLALALGDSGAALSGTGRVSGMADAAVRAFRAYPATLAFMRVLAQLDDGVRGMAPARVDVGQVLRRSEAFQAVARSVLDELSR